MSDNTNKFIAYEYMDVTTTPDNTVMYEDTYSNFGWTLVDRLPYGGIPHGAAEGYRANYATDPQVNIPTVNTSVPEHIDGPEMVTLKFKRDSRLANKREIDQLQRKCDLALSNIHSIEKKKSAYTMGPAIGIGIVGTGVLALAAYGFVTGNIAMCVVFTILGVAGWGIGFFANLKIGKTQAAKLEPVVNEQYSTIYNTCEQAHALLA